MLAAVKQANRIVGMNIEIGVKVIVLPYNLWCPHTWLECCGQYLPPDHIWITAKNLQKGRKVLRGRVWLRGGEIKQGRTYQLELE